MPIYQYHCKNCEKEFSAVHSINERLERCKFCKNTGCLKKVYSTFTTKTDSKQSKQKPGVIVKEYIKSTREEVKKEKQRMKDEEYKS